MSTLPQLSAAASAAGARVIVVQGAISGAAKVSVTSDKTIVGKAGSCTSTHLSDTVLIWGSLMFSSSHRDRAHHSRSKERDSQEPENL